jgi:hypothetical protein
MADNALKDAINEAASELQEKIDAGKDDNKPGEKTGETEETSEETEEVAEETEETSEETTEELSDAELAEVKNLYKLLKDPNTNKAVIAALAEQAGILRQPAETKAEVKEQKKSIQEILKTALPDYPSLATQLSGAIEEVLETERSERLESEQKQLETQIVNETNSALSELAKDTKGESRKLEAKMSELATRLLPANGISTKEYVRMLYTVASEGKTVQKSKANLADKINRNRTDVSSRLSTTTGKAPVSNLPDKKLGLKGSVQWALKELESQRK